MNRRRWLSAAGAALGSAWLAACDRLNTNYGVQRTLQGAEGLTMRAQRALTNRKALAREFAPADISPDFRANGSRSPQDADYLALKAANFEGYRLTVDGLVERPLSLGLADLRRLPARTQITRHDCVEGWSSIGKWKGPRLARILDQAGLKPEARYIVLHCFDTLDPNGPPEKARYYESIDLIDAYHPQTILAYEMNDAPVPVPHGAPIRLRVERQLGYKHAKYIRRIEAVADFGSIAGGKGGYWEDRGYEWYAGI